MATFIATGRSGIKVTGGGASGIGTSGFKGFGGKGAPTVGFRGAKGKVVSVKWVGLDSAIKRIILIRTVVKTQTGAIALRAADIIVREAKNLAPVDTGTLKRSIHAFLISETKGASYAIGVGAILPYALKMELRDGYLRNAWANKQVAFEQRVDSLVRAHILAAIGISNLGKI